MAVLTRVPSFDHGNGCTSTGNAMIPGTVTFRALEIIAAHMDIAISVRMKQLPGKVGMLHRLATTAVEVAFATRFSAGVPHFSGDRHQIHVRFGHTCRRRRFFISTRGIVADQAIDVSHVRKIEGVVFPTISGMARCAARLVGVDTGAEVVHCRGGFAVTNRLPMVHGIG